MTKTHAARQLLALGPLTFGQFEEITGWPADACRWVLSYLVDTRGEAERQDQLYRLTHGNELRDMPELASEGRPSHGEAQIRTMRTSTALGVPATAADVRETQAGCCGHCGKADCMAEQGVRNA